MGGIGDVIDDVIDVVEDVIEDVIDVVVDVVEEVISWIIPIPDIPDFDGYNDSTQINNGILVNKPSSSRGIPVIYGMRRVGGTITALSSSGSNNEFLDLALVLGEGQLSSLKKIFLDDVEILDFNTSTSPAISPSSFSTHQIYYGKFADYEDPSDGTITNTWHIAVEFFDGRDDQTASDLLLLNSDFDSTMRGRGVGYLAIRLRYNADVYTSLPTVNCLVQGRKVRSVDSSGNISSTFSYSANPAFCLLDYLTNSRFGKGVPDDDIDGSTFYTASQVADTSVTPLSSGEVTDPSDGSSQTSINLMSLCIFLDTRNKILDNMRGILTSCRGFLTFSAGKYKLTIENTGTASITLDESDIIGGIQIKSEDKSIKYNRVIIDFADIDRAFRTSTASFPPNDDTSLPTADQHSTLLNADGNELLEGRFSYNGITSFYQAEEHAEIILRRSRNSLRVSLKATGNAMDLTVGDIVNVTHATPSFSAKPFRVSGVVLNKDNTVNLNLVEHQNDFYTYGTKQIPEVIGDSTLPNPLSIENPSLTATDELISLFDGSVVSKLSVNVSSNDKFVSEYEVQIKVSTDSNFFTIGRSTNNIFEFYPVIEGEIYDIRARAINSLGIKSSFNTIQHEINSAFLPPDDVTNYSVDVVGDKVHHNWSPVTNLDLRFYEIRMSTDTTKTNYADTVVLVERIGRPSTSVVTPYQAGVKYFIKAVDKFGIRSTNYASAIVIEQVFAEKQSPIQTITEEPTFAGTKSNIVVVDSKLRLDTGLFDSISGNFDDGNGFFDGGSATIVSSGTYDFNTAIDLGAKFKSNVHLNDFIVQNTNFVNNFDSKQGLFDSSEGLFDGGENASVDTNVELQVATSNDNVTFGSFQSFKSGDFNTRALKFRAVLTSNNAEETPEISNMSLILSLQKRSEEGSNISSGTDTAGKTITYSNPFYQIPTLTVIAQDLQTGDFFNINSKTTTNFNIEFFNSGGSTVNRIFDYQLIGIGQRQ